MEQGLPRQDHVWSTTKHSVRFNKQNSMKCFVNWIPLNTHVRFNETQPCRNTGTDTIPQNWNGHDSRTPLADKGVSIPRFENRVRSKTMID